MKNSLLAKILGATTTQAFALIHRPKITGAEIMEVFVGDLQLPRDLNEISLSVIDSQTSAASQYSSLAIVPYRQLAERGFAHVDDESPLLSLAITDYEKMSVHEVVELLPNIKIKSTHTRFDLDDQQYREIVQQIIQNEIGHGEGCNFVIKRQLMTEISDYTLPHAYSLFRQLLQQECGAYWTFMIHVGDRTFIGSSPELHISLQQTVATMNPISGTYRYPATGSSLEGVMNFLATHKEADELYMVVEEELKMIAKFCPQGGKVVGPYLKEMSRLAHTEYFIQGNTTADPRHILRETLFAPTVTGSPIENACRIIKKYEPKGRTYYSGIAALFGEDSEQQATLDSTILIRTAEINNKGHLCMGVGSSIVRHSNPDAEAEETRAKSKAILAAMSIGD